MLVDLRSDTVTKPSPEMLEAMASASVGDDVYGEDPTVAKLEAKAAELFGKDSALFCPSGTMTNQIAVKCHTQPGDELICESNSHIYHYEGGGISFNSLVQAKLIEGNRGRLKASQLEEHINANYDWLARTSLVSLENTVNRAGGSFYELDDLKQIRLFCHQKKLALHLDGARVFNAIVEKGYSSNDIGAQFDSVSICLSKGLGAPIGSLLLGDRDFIKKARRLRKILGGGMRQAGFLAAAGIYALDHNIGRLKEDHQRARQIEAVLKNASYVEELMPVDTNIVMFSLTDQYTAAAFEEKLSAHGIKASAFGRQIIRLVTHLDFTDHMLDKAVDVLKHRI